MKLYEVNSEIEQILSRFEPDLDTGEIPEIDEATLERLDELQMQRDSILTYLAKVVLNVRSETELLKAEERRLKERRSALERKEDRLMRILDRECNGENTDCGVATVYYRKVTKVAINDQKSAVLWLQDNHEDCLRYAEPEISKNDV